MSNEIIKIEPIKVEVRRVEPIKISLDDWPKVSWTISEEEFADIQSILRWHPESNHAPKFPEKNYLLDGPLD